jgi:hypothetical protein
MQQKKLTDLTNEELLQEEKKQKTALTVFMGILCVLLGVCLYITVKQGFTFFTAMPLFFAPLAASLFALLKAAQKEIAARNLR